MVVLFAWLGFKVTKIYVNSRYDCERDVIEVSQWCPEKKYIKDLIHNLSFNVLQGITHCYLKMNKGSILALKNYTTQSIKNTLSISLFVFAFCLYGMGWMNA